MYSLLLWWEHNPVTVSLVNCVNRLYILNHTIRTILNCSFKCQGYSSHPHLIYLDLWWIYYTCIWKLNWLHRNRNTCAPCNIMLGREITIYWTLDRIITPWQPKALLERQEWDSLTLRHTQLMHFLISSIYGHFFSNTLIHWHYFFSGSNYFPNFNVHLKGIKGFHWQRRCGCNIAVYKWQAMMCWITFLPQWHWMQSSLVKIWWWIKVSCAMPWVLPSLFYFLRNRVVCLIHSCVHM